MTGKPLKASPGTGRRRITNAHTTARSKAETEKATPRARGALAAVEEFVLKNPGAHLWASDIMTATGHPKRVVQAAMGDLIRRGGYASRITVLRPGNAWRLRDNGNTQPAEPAWDPEQGPNPGGKWDSDAEPPSAPKWDLRVVGGYPDGSLALSVNGKPYHAKPLS